jgi:hypothetical protein
MACPLLEKLAPETRNLIYEYVLTFDTPLKHARKLQPFINQLYHRDDSETETASGATSSHTWDSLQRVDTALLGTWRLIFKEAIVAFYENNTIYLDAEDCDVARIVSPRANDLSLATQVTMKITDLQDDTKSLSGLVNGMTFVNERFPAIFPKLRTATIYTYTDNSEEPIRYLFALASTLHESSMYDPVAFEGVGLVTAHSVGLPGLKIVLQCKSTTERWAKDEYGFSWPSPFDISARSMYPYSKDGRVNRYALLSFNQMRHSYLPDGYPEVAEDSFEFWTIVDDACHQTTLLMQHMPGVQNLVTHLHGLTVQATTPTTQPNDASSEKRSSGGSGGEDDTSVSFEQKPESEPDSAENGADDQSSEEKS